MSETNLPAVQDAKDPLTEARERISELEEDIALYKSQLEAAQNTAMTLQAQVSKFEIDTRHGFRRALQLELTAVKGEVPILWIRANDPDIMKMQFNRSVMDMIHKVCPGVKTVMFTPPGIEITELSDKDLFKLGLARVVGEHSKELGAATVTRPAALPEPVVDDCIPAESRVLED